MLYKISGKIPYEPFDSGESHILEIVDKLFFKKCLYCAPVEIESLRKGHYLNMQLETPSYVGC